MQWKSKTIKILKNRVIGNLKEEEVDGGIMVGEKDGSPRVEESYAKQGYHPWSRTKIFLQKILTKEMNKCAILKCKIAKNMLIQTIA